MNVSTFLGLSSVLYASPKTAAYGLEMASTLGEDATAVLPAAYFEADAPRGRAFLGLVHRYCWERKTGGIVAAKITQRRLGDFVSFISDRTWRTIIAKVERESWPTKLNGTGTPRLSLEQQMILAKTELSGISVISAIYALIHEEKILTDAI